MRLHRLLALASLATVAAHAEPPDNARRPLQVDPTDSAAQTPAPPLDADPRWTAAREALRAGRWAAARDALLALAADRPDDALVHNELGVALAQERAFRAAVAALERSVALDPGRANAWANLGEARARLGDTAGAADAFCRVLALAPEDAPARAGVARLLGDPGCPAGDAPRPMAEVAPDAAPGADVLAEARRALLAGEAWRARALLVAALRRTARDAEILSLRALVGLLEGDRAGARADVAAALFEDPRSALAAAVLIALDTPSPR